MVVLLRVTICQEKGIENTGSFTLYLHNKSEMELAFLFSHHQCFNARLHICIVSANTRVSIRARPTFEEDQRGRWTRQGGRCLACGVAADSILVRADQEDVLCDYLTLPASHN